MSQVHDCPLEYPPGGVEIRPEVPVDVVDHVWVEQTAGDKYIFAIIKTKLTYQICVTVLVYMLFINSIMSYYSLQSMGRKGVDT